LADFHSRLSDFEKLDCRLAAVSADSEADAQKTIAEHALTYPVAYGANAPELGALTGAFWDDKREDKRRCLQATGFIIKADGTVAQALYSTGPIGRYTAAEALKILEKIVQG
jgi:peroxiredoxin